MYWPPDANILPSGTQNICLACLTWQAPYLQWRNHGSWSVQLAKHLHSIKQAMDYAALLSMDMKIQKDMANIPLTTYILHIIYLRRHTFYIYVSLLYTNVHTPLFTHWIVYCILWHRNISIWRSLALFFCIAAPQGYEFFTKRVFIYKTHFFPGTFWIMTRIPHSNYSWKDRLFKYMYTYQHT